MTVDERHVETEQSPAAGGLTFRAAGDRCCTVCDEVALAFDVEAGRPRCRVCGTLA